MNPYGFPLVLGNRHLLRCPNLEHVESVQRLQHSPIGPKERKEIESEADFLVLYQRKILVCGIHNLAHQLAACVALKWGAPLILVANFDASFVMPRNAWDELQLPFEMGRSWRHSFDEQTTLLLSTSLCPLPANNAGTKISNIVDQTIWWVASRAPHQLSPLA